MIKAGEYEKATVDVNNLNQVYFDAEQDLEYVDAMIGTIEYYFSWDEVHGLNLAVKYKPNNLKQVLEAKAGEEPGDDFLKNIGLCFSSDPVQEGKTNDGKAAFYYAIARRTDNGAYIGGHYNQFGATGSYAPVGGTDYVVAYDNASGYVTFEWSIPLNVLGANAAAGSDVFFSMCATAGESDTTDDDSCYGICLGDFAYGVDQKQALGHAKATLSGDEIPVPSNPDEVLTTPPADGGNTNGGDTNNGGTTNGGDTNNGGTTNGGNTNGGTTNGGTTNGGTKAPQTSDPMLILAAVSAVSACGVVVIKKRRS